MGRLRLPRFKKASESDSPPEWQKSQGGRSHDIIMNKKILKKMRNNPHLVELFDPFCLETSKC